MAEEPGKAQTEVSLENLYVIARRAREDYNVEIASRYYDRILEQDPQSWEAYFYATYFSITNCTADRIGAIAHTVESCLGSTLRLIRDGVDGEEAQKEAADDVRSSCKVISSLLDMSAAKEYELSAGQSGQERLVGNRILTTSILVTLGDALDEVFPDRPALQRQAMKLWRTALDRLDDTGLLVGYSEGLRQEIADVEERMQTLREKL